MLLVLDAWSPYVKDRNPVVSTCLLDYKKFHCIILFWKVFYSCSMMNTYFCKTIEKNVKKIQEYFLGLQSGTNAGTRVFSVSINNTSTATPTCQLFLKSDRIDTTLSSEGRNSHVETTTNFMAPETMRSWQWRWKPLSTWTKGPSSSVPG